MGNWDSLTSKIFGISKAKNVRQAPSLDFFWRNLNFFSAEFRPGAKGGWNVPQCRQPRGNCFGVISTLEPTGTSSNSRITSLMLMRMQP